MDRVAALVSIIVAAGILLITSVVHALADNAYAIPVAPASPATATIGQPSAAAVPALSFVNLASRTPTDILAGWQVVDTPPLPPDMGGWWMEHAGQLAQNGLKPAATRSPNQTALMRLHTYTDVTIGTAFNDVRNGTVGLIARASAAGCYRVWLHTDPSYDGEALVVEKVVDGIAMPLVRNVGEPLYHSATWHTLTFAVTGGHLVVTLDGQVVADVEDAAPLPAGQVGIATHALGDIFFDQITLTGVEP